MVVEVGLLTLNEPLPASPVAATVLLHSLPSLAVQAVLKGSRVHSFNLNLRTFAWTEMPSVPPVASTLQAISAWHVRRSVVLNANVITVAVLSNAEPTS